MTSERSDNAKNLWQAEITRLACDEPAELPPGFQAQLAANPEMRRALTDARALANALRVALEPEAIPDALRARVLKAVGATRIARRVAIGGLVRAAASLAAAAALVFALSTRTTQVSATGPIDLTSDDAALIAEAFGGLLWETSEYSVEALSDHVSRVTNVVERKEAAGSLLPWSADEDWDMPLTEKGASQGEVESVA